MSQSPDLAGVQRPLPHPDDVSREFWAAAREHVLRMQRCSGCGRFNHAPSLVCPSCGSDQLAYADLSGRGTVYSYTKILHEPAPGFRSMMPLMVVAVELDDQPRLFITTNLVESDPDDVRLGAPVEVVFDDVTSEITLPQFRLVKE